MKIAVLGLGYVGLANMAVLASLSHDVIGFDIDENKVTELNDDKFIFDEDAIAKALQKKRKKWVVTNEISDLKNVEIFFFALPTPKGKNGECDISIIDKSIDDLLPLLEGKKNPVYFVIRSTVEIGFADSLKTKLSKYPMQIHVISLPEFVAEGTTYIDEKNPYRMVIGASNRGDFDLIREIRRDALYAGVPFFEMSNISAELTKYAANSFLATKISFINSLARLSDKIGANILDVSMGIGSDPRIGSSMLGSGIGYGGACFPKDTVALAKFANKNDSPLPLIEETIKINETQPAYFLNKIKKEMGSLKDKNIGVLGLAYKQGIGDIRSSLSIDIISSLIKEGAKIKAFDYSLMARKAVKEIFPDIDFASSVLEAAKGIDAIIFLTNDRRFKEIKEKDLLLNMEGRYIFDGRNIFSLNAFPHFNYCSIGRKTTKAK